MANSAATKNPFARMKKRASSKYQVGILTAGRCSVARGAWWAGIVSSRFRGAGRGLHHLVQRLPEARVRLRDHLLVGDRHIASSQPGGGEGHGDAMIVVGLHNGSVCRPTRMDEERVAPFLHSGAEALELSCHGGKAIGLFHSQVLYVHDLHGP